jgi:hypothetical protein
LNHMWQQLLVFHPSSVTKIATDFTNHKHLNRFHQSETLQQNLGRWPPNDYLGPNSVSFHAVVQKIYNNFLCLINLADSEDDWNVIKLWLNHMWQQLLVFHPSSVTKIATDFTNHKHLNRFHQSKTLQHTSPITNILTDFTYQKCCNRLHLSQTSWQISPIRNV